MYLVGEECYKLFGVVNTMASGLEGAIAMPPTDARPCGSAGLVCTVVDLRERYADSRVSNRFAAEYEKGV